MAREYTDKEPETPKVSEPAIEYGTVAKERLRIVSDEELARCMTLEESERLITEKIYRIYHPEV
ncbi:MAG: hypothetical protein IKR33_08325 [Bacteroidales bacterium]|nr:hypothetical protein [Bacteroidales bacterium]